jgi:hypothetical protein
MLERLSIHVMSQLGYALEAAGFSSEDITALQQLADLHRLKDVLRGKASIVGVSHLIDCDTAPFLPSNYCSAVKSHKKDGLFQFNADKISLDYLREESGLTLKQIIQAEVLNKFINANVLDYLLAHQELIPESWKKYDILFLGTIYISDVSGDELVRCLRWHSIAKTWTSDFHYLHENDFNHGLPPVAASYSVIAGGMS